MAKIIISHFSGIRHAGRWETACYYEGLLKSLVESGNSVLHIVSSDFLDAPWNGNNEENDNGSKKAILKEIVDFSPDLVIAFNNSIPQSIEKSVDCPFILWDADSVNYFNDKNNIKKNRSRYLYFSYSNAGVIDYYNYFSAPKKNIFRMNSATSVQAKQKRKEFNISFIGSYFNFHPALQALLHKNPEKLKEIYRLFNSYPEEINWDFYNKHPDLIGIPLNSGILQGLKGAELRNQLIATIAPLGIKIFGSTDWVNIAQYSMEAFLSYSKKLVYSLEQNEDIYNRSKVSISIAHSQNITGYPWRVLDIMASNSCLVADHKTDLVQDFGKAVPLQLYNNPVEAHQLCKKILGDDKLRDEIIAASQAEIEKNFRWHHRFKEIEQITGINLTDLEGDGKIHRLYPQSAFKQKFFEEVEKLPTNWLKLLSGIYKKCPIIKVPYNFQVSLSDRINLKDEDQKLYKISLD